VTLESVARAWNEFFFTPQRPTPIALFRIIYGILVICDAILLRPDWLAWFGPRGLLSIDTMHALAPGWRVNLFAVLPPTDGTAIAIFWIVLVAAVFLTIGFLTRLSSIVVFVCLVSLHQRNIFIAHSGDTLQCITGFLLMFAPAGAALSVDRLIRIGLGRETSEIRPRAPWAQRLIQFQAALLYLASFWGKSRGALWMDGTAIYYVLHLEALQRFPVPFWMMSTAVIKLSTWLTLSFEFALGVLVWFKDLRYGVLVCGLLLHIGIEYSMNVPLFEWIMCSTYVTFVYPDDLTGAWRWVCKRAASWLPAPMTITYSGQVANAARRIHLLRALDIFDRLRFVEAESSGVDSAASARRGTEGLVVSTPAGPREGWSGLQFAARALPLAWVVALPWVLYGYLRPAART